MVSEFQSFQILWNSNIFRSASIQIKWTVVKGLSCESFTLKLINVYITSLIKNNQLSLCFINARPKNSQKVITWKCLVPFSLSSNPFLACKIRLLLKQATSPGLSLYSILNKRKVEAILYILFYEKQFTICGWLFINCV